MNLVVLRRYDYQVFTFLLRKFLRRVVKKVYQLRLHNLLTSKVNYTYLDKKNWPCFEVFIMDFESMKNEKPIRNLYYNKGYPARNSIMNRS
jgi:hypothetical protein